MINWYFDQVENIQGFVHLIYFRLIYIKINISIWLLKNKKIYFIKKQPLMKVIHQLKEVSRTVNWFFKTFTKSKFVLTYDTVRLD